MIQSKRANLWVFPVIFLLGYPLLVLARGMITGVWQDPRMVLGICSLAIFFWIIFVLPQFCPPKNWPHS